MIKELLIKAQEILENECIVKCSECRYDENNICDKVDNFLYQLVIKKEKIYNKEL